MQAISGSTARGLSTCALALTLAASLHGKASAEDPAQPRTTLARARALYLEADFEGARDAFDAILRDPRLDLQTALVAHRHVATLHLLLGDADAARVHAEAAVAIDPEAAAAEGAPPEAVALFEDAAARTGGPPSLTIEGDGDAPPGSTVRVEARLAPAPRALAAAIHLECASDDEEVETRGRPPEVAVEIDLDGRVDCEAEALSEGGARLFAAERAFGTVAPAAEQRRGLAPWVWALAGAGVAVAVGVIAILFINSSSGDQATLGSPQVSGW